MSGKPERATCPRAAGGSRRAWLLLALATVDGAGIGGVREAIQSSRLEERDQALARALEDSAPQAARQWTFTPGAPGKRLRRWIVRVLVGHWLSRRPALADREIVSLGCAGGCLAGGRTRHAQVGAADGGSIRHVGQGLRLATALGSG